MRNIQKFNAPIGKIFPENHCYFSEFRIYWEVYRSFLPAPQAGELSSCTAASGGKQAGKAKLPSPPVFLLFFRSAGIRIFSVDIAPYLRFSSAAIVPMSALSALLPNRLLRFFDDLYQPDISSFPALLLIRSFPFSALCCRPDFPFFRLCYRSGFCFFPVPISCRYFLVSGFDSSPALGGFFLYSVFRFWILGRAAFIPLNFCAVRFFGLHPPILSSYCPIFGS